ncbi:M48 family metallopeptidase [Psychroflexus aestuariivivens]|uniref:M48 family metallopeptidase n=1 Tax=Psychroflexus aestuariivivens TaxID=1795040 RepID=UPI000FD72931|nr:M48 family metallopeptidase [Psychroflexus aestuariivivens]
MTPQALFYIIIGIIILNFLFETFLDFLNAKRFSADLPDEVSDIYDEDEYQKSQSYKKEKFKFGLVESTFSLILVLAFFFLDGFYLVEDFARSLVSEPILVSLIFFGIIFLGSDLITTPFSYYFTFVIEEKYGFNTSSRATFFIDKLKSWMMAIIVGGIILTLILLFFQFSGEDFWWYTWILVALFTIFMNMFYSKLIVPIFNKQTSLEEGDLRNKIEKYARKVDFQLDNIFVIDGSKRSKKANAYFSGFGKEKRITLFDTLVNDLDNEEIVAVLAHEVGHYKKNHIIINLVLSIITIGITLWLLSLFINEPLLSQALGVEKPSFHIGLIAFSFLYTPISVVTGLLTNALSRKFEYQADNYAKHTFAASPLVSALKKLSKKSLSNLTPHPLYVFVHYSHPTMIKRFRNLKNNS